jgi:hypothetical protein
MDPGRRWRWWALAASLPLLCCCVAVSGGGGMEPLADDPDLSAQLAREREQIAAGFAALRQKYAALGVQVRVACMTRLLLQQLTSQRSTYPRGPASLIGADVKNPAPGGGWRAGGRPGHPRRGNFALHHRALSPAADGGDGGVDCTGGGDGAGRQRAPPSALALVACGCAGRQPSSAGAGCDHLATHRAAVPRGERNRPADAPGHGGGGGASAIQHVPGWYWQPARQRRARPPTARQPAAAAGRAAGAGAGAADGAGGGETARAGDTAAAAATDAAAAAAVAAAAAWLGGRRRRGRAQPCRCLWRSRWRWWWRPPNRRGGGGPAAQPAGPGARGEHALRRGGAPEPLAGAGAPRARRPNHHHSCARPPARAFPSSIIS